DDYLFRDIVYWREFQREHDAFVDALRGEGVEVLLLGDLLDEGDRRIAERLPDLVYARDICSVTKLGAIRMRMRHQARYSEPLLAERAMRRLGIPIALRVEGPALLEGGDLVYLDPETLLIGFGPRSNEGGVEAVRGLMLGRAVKELVAIPLPNFRVHLDGALMILAPDLAVLHKPSLDLYPAYVYGEGEELSLVFVEDYLRERGFDLIYVDDWEVRNFGPNIVGLGDGKYITYEWNERVRELLEERGFDVIGIPGCQLSLGGGGPHCMTCPILRDG
ncbi:MAG: arginine deiminase, partial [Candidatus Bathyarchaeota archaeon B23]